jgi:hypothetical protein
MSFSNGTNQVQNSTKFASIGDSTKRWRDENGVVCEKIVEARRMMEVQMGS